MQVWRPQHLRWLCIVSGWQHKGSFALFVAVMLVHLPMYNKCILIMARCLQQSMARAWQTSVARHCLTRRSSSVTAPMLLSAQVRIKGHALVVLAAARLWLLRVCYECRTDSAALQMSCNKARVAARREPSTLHVRQRGRSTTDLVSTAAWGGAVL